MPNLEHLRRRIDTANDLRSVVSTMKTLAAVRIQQFENAVEALAEYYRTIELGFRIVLPHIAASPRPAQSSGPALVVVFGSDQGMCGQFNEDIVTHVQQQFPDHQGRRPRVLLVTGARAEGLFLDAGWKVTRCYEVPASASDITNLVWRMLPDIERHQRESHLERLLVCYHHRTSAASFAPQQVQLLPLDEEQMQDWRREPWQSRSLPTFRTPPHELLSRLVKEHLFVSLFRACAESLASENASRIAAMQAAEKNIAERLEELRTSYNHLRQTQITEELLDVVSGFEALSTADARGRG